MNVRFVRKVLQTWVVYKKPTLKRRKIIKIFIALAVVIVTLLPKANASPLNKEIQAVVPPEQAAVVTDPAPVPIEAPQPVPEPVQAVKETTYPKGCEHYKNLYTEIFGSKADVFLKIANKESSCNPLAVGDKHLTYWQNGIQYGMSCGLLQVRYLPGRPSCSEMQNPEANARYALGLYNSGGFRHWSVCKTKVNCY
jgi:hypothetical protein